VTAIRELIFAEIESRLTAIDDVAEVERMPSGDPAKFPALHIFDAPQDPIDGEPQASRYGLTAIIEGYVSGGSGAIAHAALNDLYSRVVTALSTRRRRRLWTQSPSRRIRSARGTPGRPRPRTRRPAPMSAARP
jgi:hypothetical protein